MLDRAIALHQTGHAGKIYAISRHGLMPQGHRATSPYPVFLDISQEHNNIRILVRQVRQVVRAAISQGYDWRAVIDALRPLTQTIWKTLPLEEKQRFLRHIRPYWEVHRHRVAPNMADAITSMRDCGQLSVYAGRVLAYSEDREGVDVCVRKRHSPEPITIRVGKVINCTGPECDYRKFQDPLIANLLLSGLVRPDPLVLGLDVAANGALIDTEGKASQFLFTLGSPQKGYLWETTAVPEIRQQAAAIAQELLFQI
jgi:uncharacterized NAD(P)/FAD-binding protein YdhS